MLSQQIIIYNLFTKKKLQEENITGINYFVRYLTNSLTYFCHDNLYSNLMWHLIPANFNFFVKMLFLSYCFSCGVWKKILCSQSPFYVYVPGIFRSYGIKLQDFCLNKFIFKRSFLPLSSKFPRHFIFKFSWHLTPATFCLKFSTNILPTFTMPRGV